MKTRKAHPHLQPSNCVITHETFEDLPHRHQSPGPALAWPCPFITPAWLNAWWTHFGAGNRLQLLSVDQAQRPIGFVPLMLRDATARFCGGPDVCDDLDIAAVPDKATLVFQAVLTRLRDQGIQGLDLGRVRPDSLTHRALPALLKSRAIPYDCRQVDISFETSLPQTWQDYLARLNGKQRHEIRRKLRRLRAAGEVAYRVVTRPEEVDTALPTFYDLFRASRPEKAEFMNAKMAAFFKSLTVAMAQAGHLHLAFLELDHEPVATVLCFDYGHSRYLYNSGYDPRYRELSAGLLCKVYSLKHAIAAGCRRYDFLRGAEAYKRHLGGVEVPLYAYHLDLTI